MKGHTYYLFDPAHLDGAAPRAADATGAGSVLLCGDGLGLAQPLTAEGILPSVISGRTAAEAILAGAPADYPARLAAHPVIQDYRRVFRAVQAASSFVRRGPGATSTTGGGGKFARQAVARGFAWMFSGARLPAPRLVDAALAVTETWTKRRPGRNVVNPT